MWIRQTTWPLPLAAGLFAAGCGAPVTEPEPRPVVELTAALAPCDAAVGAMGATLTALDKGGSPVEVVKASRTAAKACRSVAVEFDASRERMERVQHAACTATGEVGETLAGLVVQAIETPQNPLKLANMEEGAATYQAMRARCLGQNLS